VEVSFMAGSTRVRVMVGYDGSVAAGCAIEDAAMLVPVAHAWITHLWVPPFGNEALRRRLWRGTSMLDDFVVAIEREGECEAHRLAGMGAVLARAAGWQAEPLVERSYGGEGLQLAGLAEKLEPDLVVIGSRGLGGVRAVFGSVSDVVVHYATHPVLVLPHPLLSVERAALADGPVLVGWDGSAGARHALAAATDLFGVRQVLLAAVRDGGPAWPALPGHEMVTVEAAGHVPGGRAVAEALGAVAAEHRAAAIVVGSHGHRALREILLGSAAMATLHHSQRPVMVVPHRDRHLAEGDIPDAGETTGSARWADRP
jgi:nucleotide-binding universal stress UspA family protein